LGGGAPAPFFREVGAGSAEAGKPAANSGGPLSAAAGWFGGLNFIEACCWSFDCCESDLWDDLFWRYSHRELQSKTQIKYGHMCAEVLSTFNSLADIVNAALGGQPNTAPSAPRQGSADLGSNVDQAVANINRLLTF